MSTEARDVRSLVQRMVDGDQALDAGAGLLVLAALAGEADLASELGGESTSASPDRDAETPGTAGSYLSSITVEGFRGVGERATLALDPGPGLTLVIGRNGSGKSSFAEAAELAVTGRNRRWDGSRSVVWQKGWRNLHRPDPVRIAVEVVGDGPPCTLTRAWEADDDLGGGSWTRQLRGEKLEHVEGAGQAVSTYRPFLSYNELGAVVDGKPSEMYDALHTLLGLDDVAAAQRHLAAARKARDDRAKATRTARDELLVRLEPLDDKRATRAGAVLRARPVELDALAELALGSDDDASTTAVLRAIAELALPPHASVELAALELDDARDALAAVSSAQMRASADLARLLRVALDHHALHGDGECPVCGVGAVDATWRGDAERRATEASEGARDLDLARRRVDDATSTLATLIAAPPPVLAGERPVSTSEVLEAWSRWRTAAEVSKDVAVAVEAADRALRPALDALVAAAEKELSRRDEVWRPLAGALMELHGTLARVRAEEAQLAALKKAEAWLRSAAETIRDERFRPFAERSQEIWQQLRQQSNVALGLIRLEGVATRRRAALDVTLDDAEGDALAVMSQGELHSLALSLFLPRATVEESPFRYLVIDDPVQAMDPAKVDGLARVLTDVARDRQVVVFSHDDRLAESIRRSQLPATVVEVLRGDRSHVTLQPGGDPVERHLADARALINATEVPPDLRSELVASYCRSALEAAGHAAFRRARIRAGDDRGEVEQRLERAHKTHQVLTLAVFKDEDRGGDLFPRLGSSGPPRSVDVVKACKMGAHRGFPGDLGGLVADTRRLCEWVGRL